MAAEHAWIDALPHPSIVADVDGLVVVSSRSSVRRFGQVGRVADAIRGIGLDVRRLVADVASGRSEDGRALRGVDSEGQVWRVRIEPLGPGRALVRFVDLEASPVPDDDEDEEPTAEIVSFERAGRRPSAARRGVRPFHGVGREVAEVPPLPAPPTTTSASMPTEAPPPRSAPPEVTPASEHDALPPQARRNLLDDDDEAEPTLIVPADERAEQQRKAQARAEAEARLAIVDDEGVPSRDVRPATMDVERTHHDEFTRPSIPPQPRRRLPEAPEGRERLALALARSIRPLLVRDDVDDAIDEALATIGPAVGADRCFLVVIDDVVDGSARNRRRYAWARDGVDALPEAAKESGPGRGVVPPRWMRVLSTGGVLAGGHDDFPEAERVILERYAVQSLVVVPVRADGRLLGFVGLDACSTPRVWSTAEREILRGLADSFAGAFRRREAAREVQEGRDRYEAAVHGAGLGLWEVDAATGRVCHADGVAPVLGVFEDEVPTTIEAFLERVDPDDRARCVKAATDHAEGRIDLLDVEVRVHAQGRPKWVHVRGRVTQWDVHGRPMRAHGTLLDIDERRQLTEEVRAAREVAERASAAKSRFLGNMSHEIRTPLNAVLGMASLLEDTPLTASQVELLATLRSSGEHLGALLDQVLDLSLIEAGELELEAMAFDLRALVVEVRDAMRPAASRAGLTLDVRLDDRLPGRVVGDPKRVRQVLLALVDNAVKFTDDGSVTITAWSPDPRDPLLVGLEVLDTGVGIDRDEMTALFDPFAQGDGSDARRHGGTGLGLAIARKLCQLLGGRLEAESTKGSGSVFKFDVRFAAAELPAPDDTLESRLPEDLRVLVVEDNVVNQKVTLGMLRRLGCEATVQDGGKGALDTLDDGVPEVVLMDIQMPEMDGLETTRRIRERLGSKTEPWIIALTAASQAADRQRSLASGMNDHLSKPVRIDELERALNRAVEAVRAS